MKWSENGKKEKMGFNKYQKRASRKTGFWSSPFCTECDSFWITTLCLLFGGDSVSMRWRRWFVFFIMIDTLYVYHRPVFSPKKWHWTHLAVVVILCFYLPQKSKFVMICILSTSRWITREWRLCADPIFVARVLCKDTLCHRASCCVTVHRPFFNLSKWFTAPFVICFFLRLILAESIWRQEMWPRLFCFERGAPRKE